MADELATIIRRWNKEHSHGFWEIAKNENQDLDSF
jgi:hypothetical protein